MAMWNHPVYDMIDLTNDFFFLMILLFKIGLLVIIEIMVIKQWVNGYKLLDGWESNVDVDIEVKYVISIFYFDILDIKNLR